MDPDESPEKCDSPGKTPREANDAGSDGPKKNRYKAFLTVYNVDHETETDYGSDPELSAKRRKKAQAKKDAAAKNFNVNDIRGKDVLTGLTEMARNRRKISLLTSTCKEVNKETKKDIKDLRYKLLENDLKHREMDFLTDLVQELDEMTASAFPALFDYRQESYN